MSLNKKIIDINDNSLFSGKELFFFRNFFYGYFLHQFVIGFSHISDIFHILWIFFVHFQELGKIYKIVSVCL